MAYLIYTLANCSSCKKILAKIENLDRFTLRNIKEQPLESDELDRLYQHTHSYEKLFNKRAQLYKSLDLKHKNLQEDDFRHYLLTHYSFLARPVIMYDESIFIGNAPNTIVAMLDVVNQGSQE